ncbi:hypothetical protein V1264_004918 [Littorina saxatilis]|uniref:Uncharacterized protein n=1 Tax=Littorina saxatilis TaxID=31220 RepID=A0AAN9G7P8_9CAEN
MVEEIRARLIAMATCVCLQTPGRRKVADAELGRSKRYDIGLQYFARKKAVISKSKSHLNDETHNPYSSSGNVVPYQSLRFHTLDIDPAMPDRTEIDDHLVKADNLHLPD